MCASHLKIDAVSSHTRHMVAEPIEFDTTSMAAHQNQFAIWRTAFANALLDVPKKRTYVTLLLFGYPLICEIP